MKFQNQIEAAEAVTNGALLPWLARAKAIASRNGDDIDFALRRLGAPAEIAARVKAAAETTATQEGMAGSSAAVTAFIAHAARSSILLRIVADSAARAVPLRTRVNAFADDLPATLVTEGKPIPISGFNSDIFILEPFKIAAAVALTAELWENTSRDGQRMVGTLLRSAVARAADAALFSRLNVSGATPVIPIAGDKASMLSGLREGLDAVHVRSSGLVYYGFAPSAANWLATVDGLPADMNPMAGTFLGRPAIVTDALQGRRIAILDADSVVAAVDNVELNTASAGAIQLTDPPTNDSLTPTAGPMVSLFQTNTIAMKIVLALAVEGLRDASVAFVDIEPE